MAYLAYICRARTDIPSGALQVVDLVPNTSNRNLTLEPVGQSGYIGDEPENDTLAALSANATTAAYSGLAAYLIDHVIDNGSGVTITVTVANAAASTAVTGILAKMRAGHSLTLSDINTCLVTGGGAGGGTALTLNGSNGTVEDVLKILSGGKYTLPSGSVVGNLAAGAALGSFDDTTYRTIYNTGALQISCGGGNLSGLGASTFSYSVGGAAVTGRAVTVYDASGTVLN